MIGTVTDYSPYYPPRIGLSVAWYTPYAHQFDPGIPVDPKARQRVHDDLKARRKAEAEAPLEGPVPARHLRVAIGVDVGGSGIKAAAVNLDTGELLGLRHRVPTPQPSAPAAVIASIARMIKKITAEVERAVRAAG